MSSTQSNPTMLSRPHLAPHRLTGWLIFIYEYQSINVFDIVSFRPVLICLSSTFPLFVPGNKCTVHVPLSTCRRRRLSSNQSETGTTKLGAFLKSRIVPVPLSNLTERIDNDPTLEAPRGNGGKFL